MSLQKIIIDLLKGIDDPEERVKIASSINMIRDMFATGKMSYDELKTELTNIVASIYAWKHPELTYEEVLEKSKPTVEEMTRAIVLSTLSQRVRSTFRTRI
jgi:hypothetical protein